MSTMHTPGPWMLTETRGTQYVRKVGDEPGIPAVASICKRGHWSQVQANGKVIQAAPDMLKALERAAALFKESPYDWDLQEVARVEIAISAAIAKATT